MKNNNLFSTFWKILRTTIPTVALFSLVVLAFNSCLSQSPEKPLLQHFDWEQFLAQHDMHWNHLTADPFEPKNDARQDSGYYAGAIMGNGLLGTNLYKLQDRVYRLNVGRSDVTEARKPYDLFNSARLPIGYFTLSTVGQVQKEEMHLSLYNACTQGRFTTDKGNIDFTTYVHALHNYIVFDTHSTSDEANYQWRFVAQKAISPRAIFNHNAPAGYLNHQGDANPTAYYKEKGDNHFLIQPLVTDSTMQTIAKVYVVAWREQKSVYKHDTKRRVIATLTYEKDEKTALQQATQILEKGFKETSDQLLVTHKQWWHDFYQQAAFLSFPDARFESFYWAQYYKFASTARPGKPIVDLQGVWPTWDTPWTAIWINLNLQLTYSWQTKANIGWLAEPLWESLYENRDNLRRNVTDIPHQADWTDAACLGRSSSYDFLSPLDPQLVERNQYEVGNLTWLLFYYWQYCDAYNQTEQLTQRFFPLLKSAINLYFHIRTETNGKYGLPATASPEYLNGNIGTNTNYDLASLRWGLQTLIAIDETYDLDDPMLPQWRDFLDNLVDYPYDEATGYKVSDTYKFENTNHRHYSHLFMIYPYYSVHWGQKENREKIRLSVSRWKGNQGYSRTGKGSMLLSMGDGNGALRQMETFLDHFVKPNTLYAETGPVIETPFAAVSTLQNFYMQDWGGVIRVFFGMPDKWKDASFVNMRALGGFLVSATYDDGHTVYIRLVSESGRTCRIQPTIPLDKLCIRSFTGDNYPYTVIDPVEGIIEIEIQKGEMIELTHTDLPVVMPDKLYHSANETHYYGDKDHR